jgi:hypothetical protein
MTDQGKTRLFRLKSYFLRNPGTLFVLIFQLLLLAVAFLLIAGSSVVDSVAVIAYCSLIVGVILQAARSIMDKTVGERT